ncbi:unnamed protein product [Prorocentrum cordatum]|uniref:BD-FAE-like domain-containing protein n=1 Tax=Prorocentrum cordatum TaxID=2364126 RepID=A0ABN9Y5W4_9DINO|nr:unnamed protein product [Polarella glacialis]
MAGMGEAPVTGFGGYQPSVQIVGSPVAVEPAGLNSPVAAYHSTQLDPLSTPEECRCGVGNLQCGNNLCCCCFLCAVRCNRIPLILVLVFLGVIAVSHYSPIGGVSAASHALFGGICLLMVFVTYLPLATCCTVHLQCIAPKHSAEQGTEPSSRTTYLGSCNRFTMISHCLVCVFTLLITLPIMIMYPQIRDLNGGALENTFGTSSPPSPSRASFSFWEWLLMGTSISGPYGAPSGERRQEFIFKTGLPTVPPRDDCERPWATHLAMDVYFPEACMEASSCTSDTELAPIIFHIHCGGWTQGDKSEVCGGWSNLAYFLERGYAVVSMQYRLTCHGYNVMDIVSDLRDAYDYVWANAPNWHFDRTSVHLMGGSAGGHLSLLMGYALTSDNYSNGGDYSGIKSITNLYGVTDISGLDGFGCRDGGNTYDDLTAGCDEDGKRIASPVSYVSASSPPTLSIHGTSDISIPYGQAVLLKERLDAVGVPNYLMLMYSWEHVPERCYYGLPAQMFRYAFERLLAARK